jgi:hypothetical protein
MHRRTDLVPREIADQQRIDFGPRRVVHIAANGQRRKTRYVTGID